MEFYEFTDEVDAFPGEYIYHEPTQQIVMCGAFSRESNTIKVLGSGNLFSDNIKNFKKIRSGVKRESTTKMRNNYVSRCKGCGK